MSPAHDLPRRSYLDYNASAPVRPQVRQAVWEALKLTGNPSSVHLHGQRSRKLLELAREQVAALACAQSDQVIFTSGGTEANHLAVRGLPASRLLVSAIEHPSLLAAAELAASSISGKAQLIPATKEGVVDLAALEAMIAAATCGGNGCNPPAGNDQRHPVLISVMLVNNETGIIQPLDEIVKLARPLGCWVHCDAVQAAGRLPLDINRLDLDALTVSAHKLGGPKGCGALIVRSGLPLHPLLSGGSQEHKFRAGSENLPGIIGFGSAAQSWLDDINHQDNLAELCCELEAGVKSITPEAIIVGSDSKRVAGTSCIVCPGKTSDFQVMALDLAGVAVSAGSACSSGVVRPSPVLEAMGFPSELAGSAIRVSMGWNSTRDDVVHFLSAWSALWRGGLNRVPNHRLSANDLAPRPQTDHHSAPFESQP